VDALKATDYKGDLETVFGRGQIVTGIGMLTGSVAGGFLAQQVSLGFPFVLRGVILLVMFVAAFRLMHDVGFTPEKGGRPLAEMRKIASNSIDYGWRVPAVKWLMVEALFTGGVGVYGFYALQPYLLQLYGDPTAYGVAGLAAAVAFDPGASRDENVAEMAVAAHYEAGTNSHPATNYETLVMTAGFSGPERTGLPKTYLRFNDPAPLNAPARHWRPFSRIEVGTHRGMDTI
jgi:MFS family permease